MLDSSRDCLGRCRFHSPAPSSNRLWRFGEARRATFWRHRKFCIIEPAAIGLRAVADLAEWDYGDYEGQRSVDVRKGRPDWNVFRDGCPRGEMPAQVSDRADRLIAHLRALNGNVALFSHGQFGRVLAARWIRLPAIEGQHFARTRLPRSCKNRERHHAVPRAIFIGLGSSHPIPKKLHSQGAERILRKAVCLDKRAAGQ
jgi:Histidine phosphatase superfamily (branch 1)